MHCLTVCFLERANGQTLLIIELRCINSLNDTPRTKMLPTQLGPTLHVQHNPLPVSVTTTEPGSPRPRTPPQPSQEGQFSTSKKGQFSTRVSF